MNQPSIASSAYNRVDWKRIGLFWLLACLFSWAGNYLVEATMPVGSWADHFIDTSIPVGFGPLLAGLLVFGRTQRVSWTGSQPVRAWLLLALLPLGWIIATLTGYAGRATTTLPEHLILTVSVLVYCTGEEWGWRGFLTEALLPLPTPARVVLIGLLWFSWHFVFYTDLLNLNFALTFLPMILLGALGLNTIITRTQSIAAVVCLHALTKINLPAPYSWGVIAMAILIVATWSVSAIQKPTMNQEQSLMTEN